MQNETYLTGVRNQVVAEMIAKKVSSNFNLIIETRESKDNDLYVLYFDATDRTQEQIENISSFALGAYIMLVSEM